jgi:hypothetical protein
VYKPLLLLVEATRKHLCTQHTLLSPSQQQQFEMAPKAAEKAPAKAPAKKTTDGKAKKEEDQQGRDLQNLHLQGAEAGAPRHWYLLQGHVHYELVH